MSFSYAKVGKGKKLHILKMRTGQRTYCGEIGHRTTGAGVLCEKCLAGVSWWIIKTRRSLRKIRDLAS